MPTSAGASELFAMARKMSEALEEDIMTFSRVARS